ncbi:UNVERIFIED_CONTAM: hypothetical protein FKN15_070758 [Acipenser sinensis]
MAARGSEEVCDHEFPSEEGDSDNAIPVAHFPLSAELMPLIKRATEALQVPSPVDEMRKHSVFEDDPIPSQVHSSWGHPATAPAVLRSMGTLYRVHDAEKLGLADFPSVDGAIASLVQAPN